MQVREATVGPLFGTTANPHRLVAVGKQGSVYLLDRDNLGGYRAGRWALHCRQLASLHHVDAIGALRENALH